MLTTFAIKTLGCKVNQYESQAIRERLQDSGLREVEPSQAADLCIVNTCTVTQAADRKSRNAIRSFLKQNNKTKMVATGCLVEFDKDALKQAIEGIDYIIPKSFFPDGIRNFHHHSRAFVKVQDGCNNRCSFCKVSLARGPSRSRAEKEIVSEVKRLIACGFKEIVLTGVCLGSFGRDLNLKTSLVRLIDKLLNLNKLKRIRLSSIEPNYLSKELIKLFGTSDNLCPHIHLPLQSGDNKILKLMNRNYTRDSFLSLVEQFRAKVPHLGLSTDVLVGFPQEERVNFENTLKVLKKALPLRVHCFIYSPREGTIAVRRDSKIKRNELTARMDELRQLTQQLSFNFRQSFLQKSVYVLAESLQNGRLSGYSGNYIRVEFPGDPKCLNQILPIKIDKVGQGWTRGVLTN